MKRFSFLLAVLSVTVMSCNHYYSEGDFSAVLKIDSHIHIDSDDGVFENQADADNFLLITLNVDHPYTPYIDDQLNFAMNSVQKHPGKVFYGPTFFFDTTGWNTNEWSNKVISKLAKGISGGAISVKVWKNIGMAVRDRSGKFIMIDDPALDPVFNYIISRGLPVTGHLGEPRNCWLPVDEMTVRSDSNYFSKHPEYHMFLHPEFPSYEDQIRARDNLLIRHPELTFIACHLGSLEWNVDSLASRFDRFPNMAADISARTCHLQYQSAKDRKRVRNFMIKYQDRLLYGTDVSYCGSNDPDGFRKKMHETWNEDWSYFTTDMEMTSDKFDGKFNGLKLPKDVVDKLYFKNAVKWYKLPVNN